MVLPPPPNPLTSPNGRHDLSDEDDDEAAIQAQEMRGAVQGLAAWQVCSRCAHACPRPAPA